MYTRQQIAKSKHEIEEKEGGRGRKLVNEQ